MATTSGINAAYSCHVSGWSFDRPGVDLVVPEADVIDVDLTVEDAFKVIMSAGLVTPDPGVDTLTVRAPGKVQLCYGDRVFITPDTTNLHRFDDAGLRIV